MSKLIIYCPTCAFKATAGRRPLRCPNCNGSLEYTNIPPFAPDLIDSTQPGHWRYAAMMPMVGEGKQRITLGEGWTPLLDGEWDGRAVYWKYDARMPTGSYRDRGMSTLINWLVKHDVTVVMNDSSGNAGASLACYASRAGIDECTIYVPESTPTPKKAQISVYGASLVEVPGPRHEATNAAVAATRYNKESAYASHAWHPAFLFGQMTCAWEIWEQLGRKVPDWIITPVGYGATIVGLWRGFQHLQQAGLVDILPRMVAVQAEPYTPIYDAFHNRWSSTRPSVRIESIRADGIEISNPIRAEAAIRAIRSSEGTVVAVDDDEIHDAWQKLAYKGLFVEPTSATVAAAISQIATLIEPSDIVVPLLTAHGLKKPPEL